MSSFLLYIIQSGCCLVLFYLGYKALLSRETFFAFNRKVLLAGIVLSLLLPFVKFKSGEPSIIQKPFAQLELILENDMPVFTPVQGELPALAEEIKADKEAFPIGTVLCILYFSGVFVVAVQSVFSFSSLTSFLKKGKKIREKDHVLVLMNKAVIPFNWGRYVVMSEAEYGTSPDGIIEHELAHLRKGHSIDLAFMEIILLLYWFNPVVWLLKDELKNIHEFEADSEVLNSGIDATKYQLLLVKKAVDSRSYPFVNSFNQSKLKKRITMMYKDRSNKQARWKLVLFVPMAAFAMYAFARPEVNRQLQQLTSGEDTKIAQVGKSLTCESFNAEVDAYYEKVYGKSSLSTYEKFDRLKEQRNLLVVLANAEDRLSIQDFRSHRIFAVEELESELKNMISTKKDDKQILIYYLNDRGTSAPVVKKALDVISSVAKKHSTKEEPVLVYCANTADFPPRRSGSVSSNENAVRVSIYDIYEKNYTVYINEYDPMDLIREKLNILPSRVISRIDIKATSKTPMGVITDIKQTIREMYTGNENASKKLVQWSYPVEDNITQAIIK